MCVREGGREREGEREGERERSPTVSKHGARFVLSQLYVVLVALIFVIYLYCFGVDVLYLIASGSFSLFCNCRFFFWGFFSC